MIEPGDRGRYAPVPLGIGEANIAIDQRQCIRIARYAREEARRLKIGDRIDIIRLKAAVEAKSGIPVDVTRD